MRDINTRVANVLENEKKGDFKMAKNQANYPGSLDILNVDRVAGALVTSDSYDIIEDAIKNVTIGNDSGEYTFDIYELQRFTVNVLNQCENFIESFIDEAE